MIFSKIWKRSGTIIWKRLFNHSTFIILGDINNVGRLSDSDCRLATEPCTSTADCCLTVPRLECDKRKYYNYLTKYWGSFSLLTEAPFAWCFAEDQMERPEPERTGDWGRVFSTTRNTNDERECSHNTHCLRLGRLREIAEHNMFTQLSFICWYRGKHWVLETQYIVKYQQKNVMLCSSCQPSNLTDVLFRLKLKR